MNEKIYEVQNDEEVLNKSTENTEIQTNQDDTSKKLTKKKFRCSVCDYSCAVQSRLKRHTDQVHEKTKPYKCELCETKFSGKINLANHFAHKHSDKKPYECEICEKEFQTTKRIDKA